jgi:large subunit ribosomal protein L32
MAHPKTKRGSSSKKRRASHFALRALRAQPCNSCQSPTVPHQACPSCGTYKKRAVMNVEKRKTRRAKRLRKIS